MSARGRDAGLESPASSPPAPAASRAPSSLHFVLIVLGDVGRSPRMQYHALSLLQEGYSVTLVREIRFTFLSLLKELASVRNPVSPKAAAWLHFRRAHVNRLKVGYVGEDIIPALNEFREKQDPLLIVIRFSVPAPKLIRRIRPVYFVWRINPPALPLLAVVYIFRFLQPYSMKKQCRRRPAVVIDWHNLGYSMLGPGGFRRLAEVYEHSMAPKADGHFVVTGAMKEFLARDLGLARSSLRVLPDCPPSIFKPLSPEQQHATISKLQPALSKSIPTAWLEKSNSSNISVETTILTERDTTSNECRPRRGRPALVTSSTSWTPDEDFGVLLSALLMLDERIARERSSLRVLVVVTGKGPQKQEYEEKMSKLRLGSVAIQTLWLEPVDYPKLLACADVGVSLHTSTSGLDLPMKVLDLFGCHVPVCALNFACLNELVQDGTNGRVFESDTQLSDLLWELLNPLTAAPDAGAHDFGALVTYSANLKHVRRWDDNWRENALPVLVQSSTQER